MGKDIGECHAFCRLFYKEHAKSADLDARRLWILSCVVGYIVVLVILITCVYLWRR